MEHRDLIKDEIEQVGKVLAKILAKVSGLNAPTNVTQVIETSKQQLNTELDIDVSKLSNLSKEEMREYLMDKKLNADHLETLSAYLIELGKLKMKHHKTEAKNIFIKANELLSIIDEVSKSMSFDRMNQKSTIEKLLQQCI